MRDYNDWRSQFESIQQITNAWGNVNDTFRAFQSQMEVYQSIKQYDFSQIYAMQDVMKNYDFSQMYQLQNTLADYDFSAALSAIRNYSRMDEAYRSASAALQAYDRERFDMALQESWKNMNWSEIAQASDVVEEVAEQYIEENQLDEEAIEEIREVAGKKDSRHLTEQQKKVWEVYIFPILLSLFFYILGAKQNQPVSANNIMEVNHHYTVEVGMEVDTLNAYHFRMICKNGVKARKKPDCSSQVTGNLPLGKVVCVVNKYKKWIEITWQSEEGEYCSGWIQNYKVTQFK